MVILTIIDHAGYQIDVFFELNRVLYPIWKADKSGKLLTWIGVSNKLEKTYNKASMQIIGIYLTSIIIFPRSVITGPSFPKADLTSGTKEVIIKKRCQGNELGKKIITFLDPLH